MPTKKAGQQDIDDLTFEQAYEQLQQILEQIEQGQVGLEQSIVRYEHGMRLINRCRTILKQAEQKVLHLQQGADQQGQLQPFEPPQQASEQQQD